LGGRVRVSKPLQDDALEETESFNSEPVDSGETGKISHSEIGRHGRDLDLGNQRVVWKR
jgi:hypothetical protein